MSTKKILIALVLSISFFAVGFASANSATTGDLFWCYTFKSNLGYINSGTGDVVALHIILDKEKLSYKPDKDNIYTVATGNAVKNFQIKYGILATGFVGTATRAKINSLYGCQTTSATISSTATTPKICTPNWKCVAWSNCVNGKQTRTCADFNYCGVLAGQPEITQTCVNVTKPVIPPSITVNFPTGGETLIRGTIQNITWETSGLSDSSVVKIWLVNDSGTARAIVSNISAKKGIYSWKIPANISTTSRYKVFVGKANNDYSVIDYSGSSDSYFNILDESPITVTSPAGGESWFLGSIHNIKWSLKDVDVSTSPVVNIWLQDDQGVKIALASNIPADSGSYTWRIPYSTPTPSGFHYAVLVELINGEYKHAARSANYFSIYDNFSITLVSPRETTCTVGQVCSISWTSSGVSQVNIDLKITGISGTTNYSIASNLVSSKESFAWTVPASLSQDIIAGSMYNIVVSSTDGSVKDSSNFTLKALETGYNFSQDNLASISSVFLRILQTILGK